MANDFRTVRAILSEQYEGLIRGLQAENAALQSRLTEMEAREAVYRKALEGAKRLFNEALPKFNWGASVLDADAIRLLNEVPIQVQNALANPSPAAARLVDIEKAALELLNNPKYALNGIAVKRLREVLTTTSESAG